MSDHLEDVDFSRHSLNIIDILDLVFLEDFNRHTFIRQRVNSKFDLAECAFTDGLIY